MNRKGVACSALGATVDTAAGACAWLYVGTVMVWILASPYPALQDYPEWLYQGHVVAALFKGSPGAAAAFEFARYPIPNSLTQIMLGLVNLVVSPLVAGKIWLCGYLISLMVVLTLIARSVHPAHWGKLLLVLTTTTAVDSGFWNGYINYQVSLLLLSMFVYVWYLQGRQTVAMLGSFALALFFCHAATFAVFVGLLLIAEATRQPQRWIGFPRGKIVAGLLPALCLLLWYTVARRPVSVGAVIAMPGKDIGDSLGAFLAYKGYTIMKQGPFHIFEFPDKTSHLAGLDALYWVGVALNGLFAVLLVAAVLWALWDMYQNRRWQDLRFPLTFAVCTWVAYFASPQLLLNIGNFGERVLVPSLLVLFCLLKVRPVILVALCMPVLAALPMTMSFLITPHLFAPHAQTTYHRFFTHRPYQFAAKAEFLSALGATPYLPLNFDTSVLRNRPSGIEPFQARPSSRKVQ
ncbi:MAG: hypothetical protein ACREXS_10030 [Gammaproteobacteria bacterium]